MQIDFHHAITYAVARMAGFSNNEAEIISYAAQYVDDSVTDGFIEFGNGMRYQRFSTAHPTKDIQNATNNNANALSWQTFHFLPGNAGLGVGEHVDNVAYDDRVICLPDSPVAKAMMASVIDTRTTPWGLHRLGIAAHVFVDTFAHQEFVGLNHHLNEVSDDIQSLKGQPLSRLTLCPPVGHGKVDTYPDRPYLAWKYTNSRGKPVIRNNAEIFTKAAVRLFEEFKRYQVGDSAAAVPQMLKADEDALKRMFETLTSDDEKDRHQKVINSIESGCFSFGTASPKYDGSGTASWKFKALGQSYLEWTANKVIEGVRDEVGLSVNIKADHADTFLTSDYKLFHDAARNHRHQMLTTVFPSFGLYIG